MAKLKLMKKLNENNEDEVNDLKKQLEEKKSFCSEKRSSMSKSFIAEDNILDMLESERTPEKKRRYRKRYTEYNCETLDTSVNTSVLSQGGFRDSLQTNSARAL